MLASVQLLDLGNTTTDIFAFLGPADQHKLRRASSALCEWFDSAAENGSLAFFATFASLSSDGLRWKHATGNPRGARPKQEVDLAIPKATVTVHVRNYCFSTFNTKTHGETEDAIIDNATLELVAYFPFEHKLVVTGLFGILSIGEDFCRDVQAIEVEFKGEGHQLRTVGSGWIADCPKLKCVTFVGFGTLEEIGDSWLYNCSSLESITFVGDMPSLKKVGFDWMSQCSKLKHVDLAGFAELEQVGYNWLFSCSSLECINFAVKVSKLKRVGCGWMSTCSKLKHVDLTGFTALENVGGDWLYECSSLESVTFAGDMPKLKEVGIRWMCGCSNLKHVDLTGFTALEEVGHDWLSECSSLESVTFAGDMPKLKRVGYAAEAC